MKIKIQIVISLLFLILVNTTYLWEGKLGGWLILAFLGLILVYIILFISLIYSTYKGFKNGFNSKVRIAGILILALVLTITAVKPYGWIDFDQLSGRDLLIARARGTANCTTTLKLKTNNNFTIRSVCFGVDMTKGKYKLSADTIYFEGISGFYYDYGILKQDSLNNELFQLFKVGNDSAFYNLRVIKNQLL